MAYDAPGHADALPEAVLREWNATVLAAYESLSPYHTQFFAINASNVSTEPVAAAHWFADPAEPRFCLDAKAVRELSDWGVRGRQALHNEYCEHRVLYRPDINGKLRPKRVQLTTELREYWVCIAHDPRRIRDMVLATLGFEPRFEHLYGVADPSALTPRQREIAVWTLVAGHGNDDSLLDAGVPAQPTGPLNTEHILFMTHPINGLDDLLYIVMFGAKPYATLDAERPQPATKEQNPHYVRLCYPRERSPVCRYRRRVRVRTGVLLTRPVLGRGPGDRRLVPASTTTSGRGGSRP